MHFHYDIKGGANDQRLIKSPGTFDKIVYPVMPLHEKNITHGSEFLDDAIRTKDQPYRNYKSDEKMY